MAFLKKGSLFSSRVTEQLRNRKLGFVCPQLISAECEVLGKRSSGALHRGASPVQAPVKQGAPSKPNPKRWKKRMEKYGMPLIS